MPIAYGDHKNFDDLIEQLNNGDQNAFDEIYKRCSATIAFLCQKFCDSKEDAEEVVQDTFVIAYKKAAELKGDTLLAYLRKIAIHECFRKRDKNNHRYEYIVRSDTLPEDHPELTESFLPEEALQNKERQDELLRIISQLPKNRREMVYLYYYADLSTEEIARLYDCTNTTVYTTLFAARSTIKSKLEGGDQKYASQTAAFVPLASLLFMEEQVFAASYVSIAAPSIVGADIVSKAALGAAKSTTGYIAAACAVAVCVASVAVYVASQSAVENDVYHPIYEAYVPAAEEPMEYNMEDIAEEAPPVQSEEREDIFQPEDTGEPTEEQEPESPIDGEADEPEPIPEPIDRTPEILAALAAAGTAGDVERIIRQYGFQLATSMQNPTEMLLRFYVANEGSGDVLIGIAAYEDGSRWHMRFAHFVGGQMPTDVLQLLRFMEQ
ncbi:MAG: sigma-70 family RNA polymerase sigma factor [Oscillospiraceae bacterium]|nr:sigma-70 family RNA polymerase sigma factor [Oscillospiraceae bacterium]